MRALLQRVQSASVEADGAPHASIGRGILVLLGVTTTDKDTSLEALAKKIAGLRIFDDAQGKTNLSCEDIGGEYLVVSQFTLCADLTKGKRPGFEGAMRPPGSEQLYLRFCERLAALTGRPVRTGKFGASMVVGLRNEGPATYWLDLP
ncbi:MAG TPA: D-aminoacyl-tRNA deacylase [Planctomycetota bacterium]|jgi:D-tyrosyl-tRNA(Tyr) deacylase|nr:D-aminoacyl-tRNA deacylase [Planctomycetota bacterium]